MSVNKVCEKERIPLPPAPLCEDQSYVTNTMCSTRLSANFCQLHVSHPKLQESVNSFGITAEMTISVALRCGGGVRSTLQFCYSPDEGNGFPHTSTGNT